MAELIGRPPDELRGARWSDFIEAENLAELPFLRPEAETGNAEVFERRVVRPDGSIVELEMHARRQRGGLFMGTARDIGPRKIAERERAILIQAIEQSADSMMITDRDGVVLYINPAMERASGWTSDAAKGHSYRELQGELRSDPFYSSILETVAREGGWSGELVSRRRDGSTVVELASVSGVLDGEGNLVDFVVVQRDITREHDLEEQLRQAQKMEAVGRLAGGVAHDFNNLLTAISGFTELALAHAGDGGELAEYLGEIRASADRAGKLTRQLLAFGRRAVLTPEVLDVNGIAMEVAPMLRRIIGENIELVVVSEPDLQPIKADRGQLEQVIVNLAANARDAMPNGGRITISTANVTLEPEQAHVYPGVEPGSYVRLAMEDTGVGIDPEMLDLIWEPFFTTKAPGSGIGLGLATVFGIVRQSGGHIHVQSERGRGSTFMIDMPAVAAEAPMPVPPPSALSPARGQETILVVEDEPAVLGFASRLLERNGYRVLGASNGTEALAIARAHPGPIDLLFSDMVMPGMSGPETAAAIKAARPRIKLLFSSGYSEEMNLRRGGEAKLPFVSKPYSAEDLLAAVRLAIGAE
jgi:PAS domain S-box-containing protein